MTRQCGECTTCCKLVPVAELHKPGNHRCQYQRHGKGCTVYPVRPESCKLWSCVWLTDPDIDLPRPDRSHYVLDPFLDTLTIDWEGFPITQIKAVQVWCDNNFPNAHRDPKLRNLLANRLAGTNMIAIVRYGNDNAVVLVPPHLTNGRGWVETRSDLKPDPKMPKEILEAVRPRKVIEYERSDTP